jgi:hypothetical protein
MRLVLLAAFYVLPLLALPSTYGDASDAGPRTPIAGLRDVNGDGKLVILCFGDSVTKGSARGTYPGMLRRLLENQAKVGNAGIFGERTDGSATEFAPADSPRLVEGNAASRGSRLWPTARARSSARA